MSRSIPVGVALLAALALSSPAAAALPPAPFHEDWESGVGSWTCRTTPTPVLVHDATAPDGPTAHRYTSAIGGGDCFSPTFTLDEGTYCVQTWIRWESGGWPFLAIIPGTWLIGQPGYNAGITPVPSTAVGWNWYGADFTTNGGNFQITTEMWNGAGKGGPTLGFFDGLGVAPGACTGTPAFPVPELGTMALGLLGLAALGTFVAVRRRR